MLKYLFFFDESFHDRKITYNEDGLNIYKANLLDSYIGVFFGFPIEQIVHVKMKLSEFEKKYKKLLQLDNDKELKGVTFDAGKFTYGLRSLGNNIYRFYKDFFNLVDEVKPYIFIDTISKTEYALRTVFSRMAIPEDLYVDPDLFFYSLTKFFINYHTQPLQQLLFDSTSQNTNKLLKNELLKTFNIILSRIANIPRKQKEVSNFMMMKLILELSSFDDIQPCEAIDFSYSPNFSQFQKYLESNNIDSKEIALIIDNENNTFEAAKKFQFGYLDQKDSSTCILTHFSDILSNFIGRFIFSLYNDETFKEDKIQNIEDIFQNNLERKRLISNEWFLLTPDRFDLYKKINRLLNNAHAFLPYPAYADQEITFFSLLKYISSYDFDQLIEISKNDSHPEFFNTFQTNSLESYFISKWGHD